MALRRGALFISIFAALSASGCGSVHIPAPDEYARFVERERVVSGSPDEAHGNASSALERLGFYLAPVDANSNYIRTENRAIAVPEFCDCGRIGSTDFSGFSDSGVIVTIAPEGEALSRVEFVLECSAKLSVRYAEIPASGISACASVGIIELDFWEAYEAASVERRAGAKP